MKFWVLALLMVAACKTPYQPMGTGGGFAEEPMGPGRFFVRVEVNTFTTAGEANLYLHRRANELCHAAGYTSFQLGNALANEQGGVIMTNNAAVAVESKDVSAMVICQGKQEALQWHCTGPEVAGQASACFRVRENCLDYRGTQASQGATQVPCWTQKTANCAYVDDGRMVREFCAATRESCLGIETWAQGAGQAIIAPCAIRYPTDPIRPR